MLSAAQKASLGGFVKMWHGFARNLQKGAVMLQPALCDDDLKQRAVFGGTVHPDHRERCSSLPTAAVQVCPSKQIILPEPGVAFHSIKALVQMGRKESRCECFDPIM